MSEYGAALIDRDDRILTHCNTGSLATAGVGTAIGVITTAHKQGKDISVWVDETRPLLQGARLTAWELEKAGVPYHLVCDSISAGLMATGQPHRYQRRLCQQGWYLHACGSCTLSQGTFLRGCTPDNDR
jgi:methylthioribose-1-phosphate isomerase